MGSAAWVLAAGLSAGLLAPRGARADAEFLRGDANADGKISISDALTIRRYLFNGDALLVSCVDAGDVDGDDNVDLADVVSLLIDLFLREGAAWGTTSIAAPFPTPGLDPNADDVLDCASYDPTPAQVSDDEIRVGDLEATPGAEVAIPFYVTNAIEIEALQLVISYDPSVFTPLQGGPSSFDIEGSFFGDLWASAFSGFLSVMPHPEEGLMTIGAIGSLIEEGSEVPPGQNTLLFKVRGTVSENAAPGTSIALTPTDGPDDAGVKPPLYMRNELTYKGQARFASILPRKVPGVLAIVDDISFFVRGDANGDHAVDISDPITVLDFLFSGSQSVSCPDAADADDDGVIIITDAIVILDQLFRGHSGIAPPFPEAGADTTADSLGDCAE
jgi:hypothetical protein